MIVLDTNVVSELMNHLGPHEAVLRWYRAQITSDLYTTAITLAEVFYGIERLPAGRRKDRLHGDASRVFGGFAEQVLPFDAAAAAKYPAIVDTRVRMGLPIDGFDAQIASICRAKGAPLATRNIKDFQHTGIGLIDPWRDL